MIASQLEIIEQGKYYLKKLSDEQYNHVPKPLFNSSAGAHMRHVIDHYLALIQATDKVINYNKRHRFGESENHTAAALQQLSDIADWLNQLTKTDLQQTVSVISEISVSTQQDYAGESTLGRELVFVSSHAVHHYFSLKLIARSQGITLSDSFGVAPATASFQRSGIAG